MEGAAAATTMAAAADSMDLEALEEFLAAAAALQAVVQVHILEAMGASGRGAAEGMSAALIYMASEDLEVQQQMDRQEGAEGLA